MNFVSATPKLGVWTLRECCEAGSGRELTIAHQITIVGRTADCNICLPNPTISKRHASIRCEQQQLVLSDLGSTNGTFVNGHPAHNAELSVGDVVQFGSLVFRVGHQSDESPCATIEGTALPFATALVQLEQLLSGQGFVPHFQPLVRLADEVVMGYELLARSIFDELSSPAAMFATAEKLGQECALSELARREGTRAAADLHGSAHLFVNTHPREIVNDRFLHSLDELRAIAPRLPITVEVHEAAVTNRDDLKRLRQVLNSQNMQLAYDDFGAGQARLDELCETPPDYLKFDIQLIRNIDSAPPGRRAMVETLVAMARDLGIVTLAEGIETPYEAQTCRQIGFQLAQGYYFGRPGPLAGCVPAT
jgi:EAL domain-containing protein (putative c-di-GMP-specific phosphodiesterase class I)